MRRRNQAVRLDNKTRDRRQSITIYLARRGRVGPSLALQVLLRIGCGVQIVTWRVVAAEMGDPNAALAANSCRCPAIEAVGELRYPRRPRRWNDVAERFLGDEAGGGS